CGSIGDCMGIPSQKANIKLTYQAPAVVSSQDFPATPADMAVFWTGAGEDQDYENSLNWEQCKTPPYTNGKNVVFVKANANGLQNGTSWENAFSSLEKALDAANYCEQLDEIWVAQGIYMPNQVNDRNKAFILPEGKGIFGGFSDTGNPGWNDRDPALYETIL